MTITATHIGTSTVQINNYWEPSSGASTLHGFDTFAAAISDAITGTTNGSAGTLSGITFTSASGITFQSSTGWTLVDSFWGYNNKTTTRSFSPIYTQVFKCLCADGNSTKNLILRYNTVTQELLPTTCEKYEVATRTITNEAFTFYDCAPIHYNLTYSDIIIMVNPRYLLLHSYVASEPTLWAGVVENNREDASDIASPGYPDTSGSTGYPCWGYISSVCWGMGSLTVGGRVFGNLTTAADAGPLWAMPRTATGATGSAAAIGYSCDLGVETYPSVLGTGTTLTGMNRYIEANTRFTKTAWSLNKLLMPIKPIHNFAASGVGVTNYGQIYGLKVLSSLGYNMNQVDIPVGSDLNANPTGTNRRHWLLNTHQKVPIAACYRDMNLWSSDFYNVNNSKAMRHVSIGSAIYVLAGTTRGVAALYKINRFTRAVELLNFANNSLLVDLVYDGERYLYITRNNATATLIRLDITDNSISTYNSAITYGQIAINGNTVTTYEYASASASTPVYRFIRQPFSGTVDALAVQATNSTVANIGTGIINIAVVKALVDFDGAILSFNGSTTTSIQKLAYDGTSGASSGFAFTGTDANDIMLLDAKTLLYIGAINSTTTYVKIAGNYPSTASLSSTITGAKPLTVANKGAVGIFKYQGIIVMETPDTVNACMMFQFGDYNVTSAMFTSASCFGNVLQTNRIFTPLASVTFSTISAKMYGSEIMATTDLGLNIWQNLNGYNSIGSYVATASDKLAQVAIPA
jgi:hypothetical protein